jgi:hypothetical protein
MLILTRLAYETVTGVIAPNSASAYHTRRGGGGVPRSRDRLHPDVQWLPTQNNSCLNTFTAIHFQFILISDVYLLHGGK